MVHGKVQKETDSQPTVPLNALSAADSRKRQLDDRIVELEVDYYRNLKSLQKVANRAYHRFLNLGEQQNANDDTKLI